MSGNSQPVQQTQGAVLGFLGGASVQQSFSCEDNLSPTMRSQHGGNVPAVVYGICSDASTSMRSSNPHSGIYEATTSRTLDANGGNPSCNQGGMAVVFDARGNGDGEVAPTMTGDHNGHISDYTALAVHQNQVGEVRTGEVANTLNTNGNASGRNAPLVIVNDKTFCIQGNTIDRADTAGANGKGVKEDIAYTLNTVDRHAVCYEKYRFGEYREGIGTLRANTSVTEAPLCVSYQDVTGTLSPGAHPGSYNGQDVYSDMLVANEYVVRRLTPTECERLQGFPDNYTAYGVSGKQISDTQRYKALGNSVAIPCVKFVLEGVAKAIREDVR